MMATTAAKQIARSLRECAVTVHLQFDGDHSYPDYVDVKMPRNNGAWRAKGAAVVNSKRIVFPTSCGGYSRITKVCLEAIDGSDRTYLTNEFDFVGPSVITVGITPYFEPGSIAVNLEDEPQ